MSEISSKKLKETSIDEICGLNKDVIVDVQVSNTQAMEADLQQQGYTSVFPEQFSANYNAMDKASFGSFGRGQRIWIWRRNQGSCAGRLQPIVDIIIDPNYTSSLLVLSGYVCLNAAISGQYVWIKRAKTYEEGQRDGILEIHITMGKMKDPSDQIWQSPSGKSGANRDGWVRVDGNFGKGLLSPADCFLWYRNIEPKSIDAQSPSPKTRDAVSLSDEVRFSRLFEILQTTIRNFVPINQMAKLAKAVVENPGKNQGAQGVSKEKVKYEAYKLFQQYDSSFSGGALSQSSLEKLLIAMGLHFEKIDFNRCFYIFNIAQDKWISHEEFGGLVSLTDFQIDEIADRIRKRLIPKEKTGKVEDSKDIGKSSTQIQRSKQLSDIFRAINTNEDGVISLDEILSLCVRLEIYVTEDEGVKILRRLDVSGNDRVEESDFIAFIQSAGDANIRKAYRVKEAANVIRRWLQRRAVGQVPSIGEAPPNPADRRNVVTAAPVINNKQFAKEWSELKRRHETVGSTFLTWRRFPGYLVMEDIMLLFASIGGGQHLYPIEVYNVIHMISLDKNGRVYSTDLEAFSGRHSRSYGELIALLERDVMKSIMDAHRQYTEGVRTNSENCGQLKVAYDNSIKNVVKSIQDAYSKELIAKKTTGAADTGVSTASNVVSIAALKRGFEDALKGYKTPDNLMPTLEEYVCLAILVGAEIASEDSFGIKVNDFVAGLSSYVATGGVKNMGSDITLESAAGELRRMILEEAVHLSYTGNSDCKDDLELSRRSPDYVSVFRLFDYDHNGSINVGEFQRMLVKMHLVESLPKESWPALMAKFDRSKKGVITVEDFIEFVKSGPIYADNGEVLMEGYGDDFEDGGERDSAEILLMNQHPPVAITQNGDCDHLTWHIWKQCLKLDSQDPENIVTDIESSCADVEHSLLSLRESLRDDISESDELYAQAVNRSGYIPKEELWSILKDLQTLVADKTGTSKPIVDDSKADPKRGNGNMFLTRSLFDKGIAPLVEQKGKRAEKGMVDYETFCRYIIKMGRSFNSLVQEKNANEEKKFLAMKDLLLADFLGQETIISAIDGNENPKVVSKMSKYEKIFKRLDSDGDGRISCMEFQSALRKAKYKDAKYWSIPKIRKLFNDFDDNGDGELEISELISAMKSNSKKKDDGFSFKKKGKKGGIAEDDSSDEEIKLFERRSTVVNDYEMFRKVYDVLLDSFDDFSAKSRDRRNESSLISSVRRILSHADRNGEGYIPEERFLSFCRRSNILASLTAIELRRLISVLSKETKPATEPKVKPPVGGHLTLSVEKKKRSDQQGLLINYNLFCHKLEGVATNTSHANADMLLGTLKDAMMSSAHAGRPFTMLCELIDHKSTGKISISEFQHVCKMILANSPAKDEITSEDVAIILDLMQHPTARNRTAYQSKKPDSGLKIDYYELYEFVLQFVSKSDSRSDKVSSWKNTLPGSTREVRESSGKWNESRRSELSSSRLVSSGKFKSTTNKKVSKSVLYRVCEAVNLELQLGAKKRNSRRQLSRLFEGYDDDNCGYIPLLDFVRVLEQDLNVSVDSDEISAIRYYLSDSFDATDAINYEQFCNLCEQVGEEDNMDSFTKSTRKKPQNKEYLNDYVLNRYLSFVDKDLDILDAFAEADDDYIGVIDKTEFSKVAKRLKLFENNYQLAKVFDDFRSAKSSSMILYEEFVNALKEKALIHRKTSNKFQSSERWSGEDSDDDKNSLSSDVAEWLRDASPKKRREFADMQSSLGNFRDKKNRGKRIEENDENWFSGLNSRSGLQPPKPSSSFSMRNSRDSERSNRGIRDSRSSWEGLSSSQKSIPLLENSSSTASFDWLSSSLNGPSNLNTSIRSGPSSPIASPKRSVSRLSLFSSSLTPVIDRDYIEQLGSPTKPAAPGRWLCPVCYYTENAQGAKFCEVCNSANTSSHKDYQLKEQCSNCAFLNGGNASRCEMCGENLRSQKSLKFL